MTCPESPIQGWAKPRWHSFPDPGILCGLGWGLWAVSPSPPTPGDSGAPILLQGHEAPDSILGVCWEGECLGAQPTALPPPSWAQRGRPLRATMRLPTEGALAAALSLQGWESGPRERGKCPLHHQHQARPSAYAGHAGLRDWIARDTQSILLAFLYGVWAPSHYGEAVSD